VLLALHDLFATRHDTALRQRLALKGIRQDAKASHPTC